MKLFEPLLEEKVIKHISKLSEDEREAMMIIHYGYLSSRVTAAAKKRLFKTIAYAEFCLALESKTGPLAITIYRAFGPLVAQLRDLKIGDKIYVRCIPVNDQEEKWYYVLEVEPSNKLGEFPLKYKKQLDGEHLNKLR